jgi:very-short-patch-repair endonuclease
MSEQRILTDVAKRLRHEMTDAERVLWREVRAHRFASFKFKRQEPLGLYVVDFVCYQAKLIVELDGGHHAEQQEPDAERTRWLESRGFRVVRFWNNDVLTNIAGVMQEIEKELNTTSPPLPGPLTGYSGLRQGIPPGEREI